ncbi:hypothetical protein CEUSTIGMA_g2439.t1 [Chlamydomonas eustigma]|uniref:Tubulin--tyrosine ligase-like protein 9 n=1 Tax=Chlamydomonas eustigma TaxID=1157962 RepID=A0A250WVW9_9CHLO|nr:hypothetical protein CEUSTIGMA_g2439.t1 [Chlamydomonas eustigma]|eukprot:GAX74993.1 hypothetical protein CEUSTIGMA_g2439.t1 [Chlamydomonas eustigma]
MLQLYEVFDADSDYLLAELAELRRQLPIVKGPDRFKLIQLQDVISTELQERGCSEELYKQLQTTKVDNVTNSPHGSGLKQGVQPVPVNHDGQVVHQRLKDVPHKASDSRTSSTLPAPPATAESTTAPKQEKAAADNMLNNASAAVPPAVLPAVLPVGISKCVHDTTTATPAIPEGYRNYDLEGETADVSSSSSSEDEMVDDAPKQSIHMTPLEAALLAYKMERKLINKARSAIVKKRAKTMMNNNSQVQQQQTPPRPSVPLAPHRRSDVSHPSVSGRHVKHPHQNYTSSPSSGMPASASDNSPASKQYSTTQQQSSSDTAVKSQKPPLPSTSGHKQPSPLSRTLSQDIQKATTADQEASGKALSQDASHSRLLLGSDNSAARLEVVKEPAGLQVMAAVSSKLPVGEVLDGIRVTRERVSSVAEVAGDDGSTRIPNRSRAASPYMMTSDDYKGAVEAGPKAAESRVEKDPTSGMEQTLPLEAYYSSDSSNSRGSATSSSCSYSNEGDYNGRTPVTDRGLTSRQRSASHSDTDLTSQQKVDFVTAAARGAARVGVATSTTPLVKLKTSSRDSRDALGSAEDGSSSEYDSEGREQDDGAAGAATASSPQQKDRYDSRKRGEQEPLSSPWNAWRKSAKLYLPGGAEAGLGADDRWSDWDILGGNGGVSAWARDGDDDELASQVKILRNARHVPPLAVPAGATAPVLPESSTHGAGRMRGAVAHLYEQYGRGDGGGGGGGGIGWVELERQEEDIPEEAERSNTEQEEGMSASSQAAAAAATEEEKVGKQAVRQQRPVGFGRTVSRAATPAAQSSQQPIDPPSPPPPTIPGAQYASVFGAFHEILSICYSVLHHMVEATGMGGGGSGSLFNASRPSIRASAFHPSDVTEKYKGLILRCRAWLDEVKRRQDKPGSKSKVQSSSRASVSQPFVHDPVSSSGQSEFVVLPVPQLKRYYAVVDDAFHPEVREVMQLAMMEMPGWELDPIDQVTEPGRPETAADWQAASTATRGNVLGSTRPLSSTSHHWSAVGTQVNAGSRPNTSGLASAGRPASAGAGSPGVQQQQHHLAGRCHMWNLLWTWSVKARVPFSDLLVWQRVNHFPEAKQLTRKDLLKKHLVRYQVMHGGSRLGYLLNILPTTYTLPKESTQFAEAFLRASHGVEPSITQPKDCNLWILKPVGSSRGRGISLINSMEELSNCTVTQEEPVVVQRYLTSPLLVQGYKFDLRLYVAVTSFNPLEAWLCTEGFARFATLPFDLDTGQLRNRFVHLTNSSIQKARASRPEDLPPFLQASVITTHLHGGSKCSLHRLKELLATQGVEWQPLWERIQEVVLVALFAAQDAIPHCVNSFELFGFDVMIDSSLKVWIIEVNSSPSLGLDTPLDRDIKPRVIRGLLQLLDPLPFDREALLAVLEQRMSVKGRRMRKGAGLLAGTAADEREMMCSDLLDILNGGTPKAYGSVRSGDAQEGYEQLAPSPLHDKLLKLKKPLG